MSHQRPLVVPKRNNNLHKQDLSENDFGENQQSEHAQTLHKPIQKKASQGIDPPIAPIVQTGSRPARKKVDILGVAGKNFHDVKDVKDDSDTGENISPIQKKAATSKGPGNASSTDPSETAPLVPLRKEFHKLGAAGKDPYDFKDDSDTVENTLTIQKKAVNSKESGNASSSVPSDLPPHVPRNKVDVLGVRGHIKSPAQNLTKVDMKSVQDDDTPATKVDVDQVQEPPAIRGGRTGRKIQDALDFSDTAYTGAQESEVPIGVPPPPTGGILSGIYSWLSGTNGTAKDN